MGKRIVKAYIFPYGNQAVFENDEQVPELQKPWVLLLVEHMEKNGVDIENSTFLLGNELVRFFRTENGWNWSVTKPEPEPSCKDDGAKPH